jgi:hypothetical protein
LAARVPAARAARVPAARAARAPAEASEVPAEAERAPAGVPRRNRPALTAACAPPRGRGTPSSGRADALPRSVATSRSPEEITFSTHRTT